MSGRWRSPGHSGGGGADSVVKVRGLPYDTTAIELCKFFTECKLRSGPRGIYFSLNDRKQPTGEAFIEMETYRDVELAMRRHKDKIGSRYIEVFESRRNVLDREIRAGATNEFGFNENRRDSGGRGRGGGGGGGGGFGRGGGGSRGRDRSPVRGFSRDRSPVRGFGRDRSPIRARDRSRDRAPPRSEASDYCVKLRGLPWSATKEDIVDFLGKCDIVRGTGGIVLMMDDRNRPSGDAYVELKSEEDVEIALKQHKKNVGSRYVEVFEANSKDVAREKDKDEAGRTRKDAFMVNLRGLPYSATESEISDWVGEVADPIEVVISEDKRGRPSGQANAYFKTEQEAKSVAREMHKKDLGTRYIECFYEGTD